MKKQYMKTKGRHVSMREKNFKYRNGAICKVREETERVREREKNQENDVKARQRFSKKSAPVVSSIKCGRKSSRIKQFGQRIYIWWIAGNYKRKFNSMVIRSQITEV